MAADADRSIETGGQSEKSGVSEGGGRLGTGRTATAIGAGRDHTCVTLDNAQVKCWGSNPAGQLGLGDTNDRGDGAGEMGDNLPGVVLW
jgi:hypothetical protein